MAKIKIRDILFEEFQRIPRKGLKSKTEFKAKSPIWSKQKMKLRQFSPAHRTRVSRSKKQRRRFYKANHRRCWYCGKGVKKKGFILEHQTPFSRGGSCKLKENIVLACENCDKSKGNKTVAEFRASFGEDKIFYGETKI